MWTVHGAEDLREHGESKFSNVSQKRPNVLTLIFWGPCIDCLLEARKNSIILIILSG